MKNYTNILYWIAMAALLVWFAYSKGWILANFKSISAKEAYTMVLNDKNVTLLDVRTNDEFNSHHIENALLIPVRVLEKNLVKIQTLKKRKILVYCQTGRRSVSASRILENNGFVPINIEGGIIAMKHAGFSIIK